jgi:DNA-binding LytR/AlgR family response regulator
VRERRGHDGNGQDLDAVLRKLEERQPVYVHQIPVYAGKRILILPVEEILWFGVEYRLVYAHTRDRPYMTNYTLRELEERLDPALFFRAHKSSLVSLQHVKEIVPWFGGRYKLVMRDEAASEVALSRAQARSLRSRLRW